MEEVFRSEFFLGLVVPVGIDADRIIQLTDNYLSKKFQYKPNIIRLSALIHNIPGVNTGIDNSTEYSRIDTGMRGGNEAREISNQRDILAQYSIVEVQNVRKSLQPEEGNVYVFRSIKNPDEAILYRQVYGKAFFLLGFSSIWKKRQDYLVKKGMAKEEAEELLRRDEVEHNKYGQDTRNVFYTSDVFFDVDNDDFEKHLERFFDLIFGHPYLTPTKDEFAMFLAFSSSYRSADLSRQVGAVISSESGEIIATGCNDVPKKGGGLYWSDDEKDMRDFVKKHDPNERRKNKIANKIEEGLRKLIKNKISIEKIREVIKNSGLSDITEYGRAVHAEMEALLACSRVGVSLKGGTIYSTTFPCHNCAKHIIASGVVRVVFVEPYPKSKALELYGDSAKMYKQFEKDSDKVIFQPFVGVGPRRFIDLFSLQLSNGIKIERKQQGKIVKWPENKHFFRFPLLGMSYLDKEKLIGAKLKRWGGR